jgi:hypothetical protein
MPWVPKGKILPRRRKGAEGVRQSETRSGRTEVGGQKSEARSRKGRARASDILPVHALPSRRLGVSVVRNSEDQVEDDSELAGWERLKR